MGFVDIYIIKFIVKAWIVTGIEDHIVECQMGEYYSLK